MNCARTREIQENVIFEDGGWEITMHIIHQLNMRCDREHGGTALFRRCLLMTVASGIIRDHKRIPDS